MFSTGWLVYLLLVGNANASRAARIRLKAYSGWGRCGWGGFIQEKLQKGKACGKLGTWVSKAGDCTRWVHTPLATGWPRCIQACVGKTSWCCSRSFEVHHFIAWRSLGATGWSLASLAGQGFFFSPMSTVSRLRGIVCLQVAIAMQLILCGLSGSGSSIYTLGPKMLQQLQKNALSCHLWLPTRAIWFGSHNLALCSPSAWWHVPKRSCRWKNVCRIALHWLSVWSDFHFSCDLILLSLYTFFLLTLFRFVIIYYLFSVFVCSNSFSWIHTPRVPHFNLYFLVCASSALLFITVAQNSSFLLWWLHGSTLPRPHCVFEPFFVLMSSMHCSSASKGRQEK